MRSDELNALSKVAVDGAFSVYTSLGPGLLENVYTACLALELRGRGLQVDTEVPVPVVYQGQKVADIGYRMDLLVARELVIEVKAVDALHPIHGAQLLSYLRLADKRLGLLINFNSVHLRDGIRRLVNGL